VCAADLDQDGDADAVSMTALQTSLVFFENDGTGRLVSRSVVPLVQSPDFNHGHVAVADLNGDGLEEVLATVYQADQLRIFRNTGTIVGFGQPAAWDIHTIGPQPSGVEVADLNGDGHQDVLVGLAGDNTLAVLLGLGEGELAAPEKIPIGVQAAEIRAGDFDADGDQDAVLASGGGQTARVFMVLEGDGSGELNPVQGFPLAGFSTSLERGDFDEDGDEDLVVGQPGVVQEEIQLFLNLGGLVFERRPIAIGPDPGIVIVEDVDRDGHLDVLVLSATRVLRIAHGDGSGDFPSLAFERGRMALPYGTLAACFSDLDGDGLGDLLMVSAHHPMLWVGRNTSVYEAGLGVRDAFAAGW
jgi:hypothetical protein